MATLIAVIGRRIAPGGVTGWKQRGAVAVPAPYLDALQRAGAVDATVYPTDTLDVGGLIERCDGLLLVGGSDVNPQRYGAVAHPRTGGVDDVQDAVEIAAVDAARAAGRPVLAVCRGMQVLNVALGGSLHQHIPDLADAHDHTVPGASEAGGRHLHPVRVEAGSRVAKAMATERPVCPSSHHQALDRLGAGLVATAWSDDGLVEAVEHADGWIVGVQWHPESSADDDPAQQGLFDAFVVEARGRA